MQSVGLKLQCDRGPVPLWHIALQVPAIAWGAHDTDNSAPAGDWHGCGERLAGVYGRHNMLMQSVDPYLSLAC